MGKWIKDVDDYAGAKEALKAGEYGAYGFAAMHLIALLFLFFSDSVPGVSGPEDSKLFVALSIGLELALVLVAAWRFRNGKGLVWGALIAAMFAFEVVNKVVTKTTNVGWMFFYAAVGMGLVNGIRGAWAIRTVEQDAIPETEA